MPDRAEGPRLTVREGAVDAPPAHLRIDALDPGRSVRASVVGAFDMAASPRVARQILEILVSPIESLVLELSDVTFMDSAGLAVLNVARTHAQVRGVRLVLRDISAPVKRVFEIAGMVALFEITGPDEANPP